MGLQRAIRGYFIPVVVLCSVCSGVMGGAMIVGAVTGTGSQADRLDMIGETDPIRDDGPPEQSLRSYSAPPNRSNGLVSDPLPSSTPHDDMTIEAVTTRTAPGSKFDDVQTTDDVSELAPETETVAAEDVLVIQMTSRELSNAVAGSSNTTSNARLLELVQSGVLDVRIENGASNTTLDLPATNETGGLRVIPETDGSAVYVLIDTERAVFSDRTTGVTPGNLTVTIASHGTEEPVSSHVTVTPREASFETNDGKLRLTADSNRTITGDTTVAPNTNLTVHVRANEEATFNITRTTRVNDDGSFSLRVDFGNVTKGTRFVVLIPNAGFTEDVKTEGVLTATSTASVRLTAQHLKTDESQTVTVRSANLSEGGFLAVYNRSFLTQNRSEARKSYQGVSEYHQPGSHSDINITLDGDYRGEGTVIVVPHLDTNDNGQFDGHNASLDEPYRGADGGAIIAMANASSGTVGGNHSSTSQHAPPAFTERDPSDAAENGNDPSQTTTPVATGQESERGTQGTGSNGSPNAQLTEVDGPGFGPLAGLIAVGITTLIAMRSRL
ncbi:DUF7282 domain-containing protein [Halocatena pleomorpha]|uniref:DUF7282 domain-containing protein n=1 Tax=Halocatena pleomorpha TaxID=1785090 RepID=A0A3P3RGV3_9EURY|nr:BGTF surface domain-containing protein [Halocatena pleomorpha]RRJ31990.1 hypothetical protein EIK79_05525 [Halocatena pleomorpha]